MSALADHILAHAEAAPEGTTLRAKELLHLGSRAAVDQALVRLSRSGALSRIGRGLYLRPRQGKYGPRTPSAATVVQAISSTTGEVIASHGAAAANALGLTTQIDLDAIVRKAADKKARDDARKGIVAPDGASLKPASETGAEAEEPEIEETDEEVAGAVDLKTVFADRDDDLDDDED